MLDEFVNHLRAFLRAASAQHHHDGVDKNLPDGVAFKDFVVDQRVHFALHERHHNLEFDVFLENPLFDALLHEGNAFDGVLLADFTMVGHDVGIFTHLGEELRVDVADIVERHFEELQENLQDIVGFALGLFNEKPLLLLVFLDAGQ